MRKIIFYLFSFFLSATAFAQQDVDALIFSKTSLGGTARNMGVGGVMGSVGGDISSVINNPAGLAQFSKSEFTISPSLLFNNSKSNFLNNQNADFRTRFMFSNMAVVFANRTNMGKLRSSNWSVNFNRISNFTNKVYFEADNMNSSYAQSLAESMTADVKKNNGLPIYSGNKLDQSEYNYFGLKSLNAYDTYLMNYDTASKRMYSIVQGGVKQSGTITTTGGVNEFGINWAGDFNNKILVGIGINFDYLSYSVATSYNENDLNGINAKNFIHFNSTDLLEVEGMGANLKAGVLVKPNDYLRVSAFVHTPTYFGLKEEFSNQFRTKLPGSSGVENYESSSPSTFFNYNLFTPWRLGLGLTGIIKNVGFLSAEYELTDYSDAFLVFDGSTNSKFKSLQVDLNKQIASKYSLAHTFKIGAEYSIEQFRLRAGYVYKSGVFNSNIAPANGNQAANIFTGGLGYRSDNFGFDLAYVRSIFKDYMSLYSVNNTETGLNNTNQFSQIVTTFTFKF